MDIASGKYFVKIYYNGKLNHETLECFLLYSNVIEMTKLEIKNHDVFPGTLGSWKFRYFCSAHGKQWCYFCPTKKATRKSFFPKIDIFMKVQFMNGEVLSFK